MRTRTLAVVLVLVLVSQTATALPRTTEEVASSSVSLTAGWESTWVAVATYGLGLPDFLGPRGTVWQSELVLPISALPAAKLATGLHGLFGAERGFAFGAVAKLNFAWTVDPTGAKAGVGGQAAARPGYYTSGWSLAGDLGWRSNLLTFVGHSENVDTLFEDRYPEGAEPTGDDGPRDGFIGPQAHRIQLGIASALRLSEAVKLTARGGVEWAPTAAGISTAIPVRPLPFYALLGGAFRW